MALFFQLKNDANVYLLRDALLVAKSYSHNSSALLAKYSRDLEVVNFQSRIP